MINKMPFLHTFVYCFRGEKVNYAMHELKKLDFFSKDELDNYKIDKLLKIKNYVKKNIPYYFVHNFDVINKEIVRKNINILISKSENVTWRSTSGTSGEPLVFTKDRNATAYMDAMMFLAYSWHGIKIKDKQARIWGRSLSKKQQMVQSLKDFVLRRKRLSAFEMNEKQCMSYFDELIRFKPKYFYAYSNALFQFALFVEKMKLDSNRLNVKVAICTGEILFPYQREKIAEVLNCKVVNEYGSTENGIIGFECEFGKMHVMPTVNLEIESPDSNGVGNIVITELNSKSVPFIKYKNGDIGKVIYDHCLCGRPYEILEIHEGRIDSYIRCPNGSLVYDAILAYSLKDYVTQFKGIQREINRVVIYIIPNNNFNVDACNYIKNILNNYLGNEMIIDIEIVDHLPVDKSGKFRYFIPLKNV